MNKYKTELKWALIFVAGVILWNLLGKILGMDAEHIDKHVLYSSLFTIPAILLYVLVLIDKRKYNYKGFMTYKQGVMTALTFTLFLAIFGLFTPSIATFISPEYYSNAIQHAVETGEMTREQANNMFNLTNRTKGEVLSTAVFGTVFSLIIPIFTKKKSPASI